MSQQDCERGYVLNMTLEVNGKEVGISFSLADGAEQARVDIAAASPLKPVEIEMTLYQVAHAIAEATRTKEGLLIAKNIWI